MAFLTTDDNVKLYYEDTGTGTPVIFVHEFAGDYRSWEPQVRHFARRYRCVAYNARGWPPSEVPQDVAALLAGSRPRRHPVRARSSEDRQGACGRSVDGRLCHAAFRPVLSRTGALAAGRRGRRLRRRERISASASATRRWSLPASSRRKAWRPSPRPMPMGRRACSSRTRTRAALPSSSGSWPSTRPRVPPTPSSGCSASARRSSTWSPSCKTLNVPTLILNGDEDWPCLLPGVFMKRTDPFGGPAADPEQRSHHQHRGARCLQCRACRVLGPGRRRPLAHARPARRQPEHHGHDEVALRRPDYFRGTTTGPSWGLQPRARRDMEINHSYSSGPSFAPASCRECLWEER